MNIKLFWTKSRKISFHEIFVKYLFTFHTAFAIIKADETFHAPREVLPMKKNMPTMKDIAKEAGVALGTVSKVIFFFIGSTSRGA